MDRFCSFGSGKVLRVPLAFLFTGPDEAIKQTNGVRNCDPHRGGGPIEYLFLRTTLLHSGVGVLTRFPNPS